MNNEWASGTMDLRDSRQWTWGAMDLRNIRHGGQWTTDLGDNNVWYLYSFSISILIVIMVCANNYVFDDQV